jgi:hypothetical protein
MDGIKRLSPIAVTMIGVVISIFLSATFLVTGGIILLNIGINADALLQKLSPMILPSIIGTVGIYQGQTMIKSNSSRDTAYEYSKKDIYSKIRELKQNEEKLEEELYEMKERILKLEHYLTVQKND